MGRGRQGLGWNFPEASRNRSPAETRIRQPAGFRRFPCYRSLCNEAVRETPGKPQPNGG